LSRINFILSLKSVNDADAVESFIKELSVPYTLQCEEPNTISFEWFFDKAENRAVILESFVDSEAATLRVKNLMASPVNEPFGQLFDVLELIVLGEPEDSLKEILESWSPLYLPYIDGFNKYSSLES